METQEFNRDADAENERLIVKEAEELAKKYNGRLRRENWSNEKDEPMVKIVLTFKL